MKAHAVGPTFSVKPKTAGKLSARDGSIDGMCNN